MYFRSLIILFLLFCFLSAWAGAESQNSPEDAAAAHLDHLAFALDGLRSDQPEVRGQAIGRLVFYQGDSVAEGILVEHWFGEADGSNRIEILQGLLRNGTLSEGRVSWFRNSATRFGAPERDARLKELTDVLPTKP